MRAVTSHTSFADAFDDGARLRGSAGGSVWMSTRRLGALRIVSGTISVADPFTTDLPRAPLDRTVPIGEFPLELAIARFENGDQRVACARVRFADRVAERWVHAWFRGGREPGEGEIAAYGVDAGTGSFFDASIDVELDDATGEAWLVAMRANDVETWSWHVAPLGSANVVMFSSGWGDGRYASWWGEDGRGELVELVTDFEVLLEPTTEPVPITMPSLLGGRIEHPTLREHGVSAWVPPFARRTIVLAGEGGARVELEDGSPVAMKHAGLARRYTWESATARPIVRVMTGVKPLDRA